MACDWGKGVWVSPFDSPETCFISVGALDMLICLICTIESGIYRE